MKNAVKIFALTLCIILSIAVFTGCEKKPGNASATPAPGNTATESAAPKQIFMKAGDVYRYYAWNFATETQPLEEEGIRGDDFRDRYAQMEADYGIDIQFVVSQGQNWMEAPLSAAYAGTPITDVMNAGGPFVLIPAYMYQQIPGSAVAPLDAYPDAATFSDANFWDVKTQQASGIFNNHLYFSVPAQYGWGVVSLNQVTFFNKSLVEKGGFTSDQMYQWSKNGEWTWEKLEQVAVATTNESEGTYGLLAGENNCIMFSLVAGNGADYIAKREVDGVMKDRFVGMEEKAIKAWDFFVKLSVEDKAVLQYTGSHETVDFSSGKVAMMLTYVNRAETISKLIEDFDYGMIMPPKGPDATDYISDMNWFGPLCMMQNVPNPQGTVQFMEMFFAPPYGASSQESIDLLKTEITPFLRDEESVQTCIDVIDKTSPKSYMNYAGTSVVSYIWYTDVVNKLINKEVTPAAYFASVEETINAAIDQSLASNTDT